MAVLAAHGVLSIGFDAYTRLPSLDIPVHFIGGVAIAFALNGVLTIAEQASLIQVASRVVRFILTVCLVTTAATGWEFVEFVFDRVLDTGAQKGLEDTLFDAFVGIVGGMVFAAIACTARRDPVH